MKRGAITLYLCLILSILLSLVAAAVRSAEISAGRVILSSTVEQTLFSLFSEYDKELFDRYGLLFIDGGRGKSSLQLQMVLDSAENYADYILHPEKGSSLSGRSPVQFQSCRTEILGYSLATDGGGAAFSRQACTAMKDRIPAEAAAATEEKFRTYEITEENQKRNKDSYHTEKADDLLKKAEKSGISEEDLKGIPTDTTAEDEEAAGKIHLAEDYGNPVDAASHARKLGLLSIAVPKGKTVSDASADGDDLPSARRLQRGVGVAQEAASGLPDKTLLLEYAGTFLPSFTDEKEGSGLRYQMEYAVAGKSGDQENIKAVLAKLLLIREASNFAYLSSNKRRRAEALAAAELICAALAVPYLAPAAAIAVRGAWAYGESILDLRELLSGGKIPLVKTDDSWQLSIASLPDFLSGADAERHSSDSGLDYEQYLKMLLSGKSTEELTSAIMDMVEHTMRTDGEQSGFRIDNCIAAINLEMSAVVEGSKMRRTQFYCYGGN